MVKTYSLLLDTKESVSNPSFKINTNDLKTVKLSILINQDTEALDLTGATVRLAIKKPDLFTVLQDCTIIDPVAGSCEIILDTQAYAVAGDYLAEVMVYYGTDTVAVTCNFTYTAKKGIMDEGTLESTNDWQSFSQVLLVKDEVAQSRTNNSGTTFTNLKARLDTTDSLMADKAKQTGNRITTAWDTFNRADGQTLVSEDGQSYLVAGDNQSCLFQVKNNKAVLGDLGNAYLSLDAGDTIETIGAEWVWENGTTQSTVAVVITNDQTLALGNLLHFITNTQTWNLQIRKGGSANTLTTVMSGAYKTPLTKDGLTKYRFEMSVAKDKNTVYLRLPDGDVVSYTHTDVPLVTGSRGYWQIIRRLVTDEEPKFTSFWLTKKDNTKHNHSGKENMDIFQGIIKTKEYIQDNGVLKKVYNFTPASAGWHRILSGTLDTLIGTARIYTDGMYDSSITDLEFEFGSSAFNGASPTIQQRKHSTFNDGIISQIRVGNNGSNVHYLDVYIKSVTSPKPIYFEFSGFSLLKSLNTTQPIYNPTFNPVVPTNSATLTVGKGFRTTSVIHSSIIETEFETVITTGNVNMNQSITAIDATTANITLTLPNSTQNGNHVHTLSRLDGSANTVSVIGFFSDGTTTKNLSRGVPLKVVASPSSNLWIII